MTAKNWIKNIDGLATTETRKLAFKIVQAGLDAINTEEIIKSSISLNENILTVKGQKFDINKFKRIKILGFGKASCEAAYALEKILGSKIHEGVVIGLNKIKCDYIETFSGSHPRPSFQNTEVGLKIIEIGSNSNENDLVIVIVSGGGSSLLCGPEDECDQEIRLYDAFLERGKNISELNTIRKHISQLKGGGLAKILYPASVIGLIFSDVPGNHFEDVASGPTYKDDSTTADAQKIIDKYSLGRFNLIETPKEDKYFEKVKNFVLVSNTAALEAMKSEAENLGMKAEIISNKLYDEAGQAVQRIIDHRRQGKVILAGGEPHVDGDKRNGTGGRCLYMGMKALELIDKDSIEDSVFVAIASDGIDNSLAAGAVVDWWTLDRARKNDLNLADYIRRIDSYSFFEKTGDIIFTDPTNANVSDLMILLTK